MTKQEKIFCSAQRPLIEKPDRERYACLDHRWASTRAAGYFFSRLTSIGQQALPSQRHLLEPMKGNDEIPSVKSATARAAPQEARRNGDSGGRFGFARICILANHFSCNCQESESFKSTI